MTSSNLEKEITFVLTSCGRFDLLAECLSSFLMHNDAYISRYIVIEDSGDTTIAEWVRKFDLPIEVLINDPPQGQIASIDRAYTSITTPYIFHCEDDWRFTRSGFIEESKALLDYDLSISNVIVRRSGQNPSHDLIYDTPTRIYKGIRYHKAEPSTHPVWFGYSFNPGLRRLADYKMAGSFKRWGNEAGVSMFFKSRGMTIANLNEHACETTGSQRRLPKLPPPIGIRWRNRIRLALQGPGKYWRSRRDLNT